MTKDIKFIGPDSSKTDIDCADGEVAISYGIGARHGRGYCNTISAIATTKIPYGYSCIATHKTLTGRKNLILKDREGNLCWCTPQPDMTEITEEEISIIGTIGEIRCTSASANILTFGTDHGIQNLLWINDDYTLLPAQHNMPNIDFGIQRAGSLSTSERIETDADTYVHLGTTGNGASMTHPITTEIRNKTISIGESIASIFEKALDYHVHSKGYFDQPFFVMYAYRLYDGTHIMPSSPILMLPTTLPPVISLTANSGQDNTYINIDLTSNDFFEIRYKINETLSDEWKAVIKGIDVFVSLPIRTYDTGSVAAGHITKIQNVINATDSGGSVRGRHYPSRDLDESGIFLGHYSRANDDYRDHMAEPTDSNVWYIRPNPHFQDDIVSERPMYLIASIPAEKIEQMAGFATLDILTAYGEKLTEHPEADLSDIARQRRYQHIIPTAMTAYATQTVVAADSQNVFKPLPLNAVTAYSGNAQSSVVTTEISVYTKKNGKTYRSTTTYSSQCALLSENFPRYIHHPDPDAFLMTLRQGASTYTIPLTPETSGRGAYWWGGLRSEISTETLAVPTDAAEGIIRCHTEIFTSKHRNPFAAASALTLGDSKVIGLTSAMEAPYRGNFGQYPLYAFSEAGVWLLQYNDKESTFSTARIVTNDRCINADAITVAGDRVIYATSNEIKSLTGSKTEVISDSLPYLTFDITSLPHIDELLKLTNAKTVIATTEEMFNDCFLLYDIGSNTLILSPKGCDFALIKPKDTDSWAITDLHLSKKISDGYTESAVDVYNAIVAFGEAQPTHKGLLVTRPMKLASPIEGKDLTGISILGYFKRGNVGIALYGADRLNRWHLIGTSHDESLDDYNSRRYKYIRLIIVTQLEEGEYLYGTSVQY